MALGIVLLTSITSKRFADTCCTLYWHITVLVVCTRDMYHGILREHGYMWRPLLQLLHTFRRSVPLMSISWDKTLNPDYCQRVFFFLYIFNTLHSADYRLIFYTCSDTTIGGEDKQVLISGTGDWYSLVALWRRKIFLYQNKTDAFKKKKKKMGYTTQLEKGLANLARGEKYGRISWCPLDFVINRLRFWW